MKYKAIIFDLDGTLVHTLSEYRYMVVGKTLKEFGQNATEKNIDRFWFEGDRDTIIKEIFHVEPKKFWHAFRTHDNNIIRTQHTKPYEDIKAIHELKAKGFLIGIVTGAPTHIAELEINLIGKERFDCIICAHEDNGYKIKPDPHGIIECMKKLGVNNNEAVYVGNADEDVEAARNAKVLDVLIDRDEHDIKHIKPRFKIKSLHELHNILE
jgi:phosphoglycolate phosphatase-like HAD superfamily hydrolase